MKRLVSFAAVLLMLLSLFGSVSVSAEAVEEEKTGSTWIEYQVGSFSLSAPKDWIFTVHNRTGFSTKFGDSSLDFEIVYDNQNGLPGAPEDAIFYGNMLVSVLQMTGPAELYQYEYRQNGLHADLYYAQDLLAFEDCDAIVMVLTSKNASGVISGELHYEDLYTYRMELLGILMSVSVDGGEEAAEDTESEEGSEDAGSEEGSEDAGSEEGSEDTGSEEGSEDTEPEEAAEDSDTEEAGDPGAEDTEADEGPDAPAEVIDEETDTETSEDGDADEAAVSWAEESANGILFRVPDDWEKEEGNDEGFYRFMFGNDNMFAMAIVPVSQLQEEYEDTDDFMREMDEGVKSTASMLHADVFETYQPYTINDIEVHMFYLSRKASGGSSASDYIRFNFIGENGAGMASFNYMDPDMESFPPILFGVLTSLTQVSTEEQETGPEEEESEEAEPAEEEKSEETRPEDYVEIQMDEE